MKSYKKNLQITSIITVLLIVTISMYYYLNRPPSIYWEKDSRQMYSFFSRTIIHSASVPLINNMPASHSRINIRGLLNIRIFDINNDNIRAGMQFSRLEIKNNGKRDTDFEDLFSGLFYVLFSIDGEVLNYNFSNEISEDDRKSVEDIVNSLQIIVPRTISSSWNIKEEDKFGIYSSEYDYDEILTKSKKEYIEVFERNGLVNINKFVDIKKSDVVCEYGYPDTWIKNLEIEELTVFYNTKRETQIKFASKVILKKIHFNPDSKLAIWESNRDPQKDISEWSKKPIQELSISRKRKQESLKKFFGTANLNNVLNKLLKKYTSFSNGCVNRILHYLKLYPEAAAQIPEYLLKNNLNVDQRAMLVNALQINKGDIAQKALLQIMNGDDFPPGNRVQSAIALGDILKPAEGIIQNLWETFDNRNNDNDITKKLSDMSMLSLGRISRTMSQARFEDVNTSNEIKNRIRSELAVSTDNDPGKRTALIYAAANTGDNDFIEPLSDSFLSETPLVRSAAALSLSIMNDERVDSILTDELSRESNVNVRTSIVKGMYGRKVTEQSIDKICEEIKTEDNDIVRGEMYRFLLKNRKQPGVRDTLLEMEKRERSLENRMIISRALASRK